MCFTGNHMSHYLKNDQSVSPTMLNENLRNNLRLKLKYILFKTFLVRVTKIISTQDKKQFLEIKNLHVYVKNLNCI